MQLAQKIHCHCQLVQQFQTQNQCQPLPCCHLLPSQLAVLPHKIERAANFCHLHLAVPPSQEYRMLLLPLSIASDVYNLCYTSQSIRHEAAMERGLGGEVTEGQTFLFYCGIAQYISKLLIVASLRYTYFNVIFTLRGNESALRWCLSI